MYSLNNQPTYSIKPGILVALRTVNKGGVEYHREDLDVSEVPEVQAETQPDRVEKWATTKIVHDEAEFERAKKARGLARTTITRVCSQTAFGLLCAASREEELNAAIVESQRIVEEFNSTSDTIRIGIFILKGRIRADDVEAAKAIRNEVSGLLMEMERGIEKLDPKAIREACQKAKAISEMLEASEQVKVSEALELARKNARDIVRRIEKNGESAQIVLSTLQRGAITNARMAFLDLNDEVETGGSQLPTANLQRFASLDDDDG